MSEQTYYFLASDGSALRVAGYTDCPRTTEALERLRAIGLRPCGRWRYLWAKARLALRRLWGGPGAPVRRQWVIPFAPEANDHV